MSKEPKEDASDLVHLRADRARLEKFIEQLNSVELSRQEGRNLSDDAIGILVGEARFRARLALGREPNYFSTSLFKDLLQLCFRWHSPSLESLFSMNT